MTVKTGMTTRLLLACLLLMCATAAFASGEDLVRAMLAKQASYSSVQADFTQERELQVMAGIARAAGTVSYARPDLMRWDYREPQVNALISNGDTLWYHVPELNQCSVMDLDKHQSLQRLLIALAMGNAGSYEQVEKHFRIFAAVRDGLLKITLKARQEGLFIRQVSLAVDRTTMLPQRVQLTDANGDRSVLTFSNFRVNGSLPAGFFTFVPPPGCEMATLDMLGIW